jgi:hypothetical protein
VLTDIGPRSPSLERLGLEADRLLGTRENRLASLVGVATFCAHRLDDSTMAAIVRLE